MSEESRITLWRRAIRMLKRYGVDDNYVDGVFYKAGIKQFVVEKKFDDCTNPDIVAWNTDDDDETVIFELTLSSDDKTIQLVRYARMDTKKLIPLGIQTNVKPDIILGTPRENKTEFAQFILADQFSYLNLNQINNEKIINAAEECKDMDLTRTSEIPFRILPESKRLEIRRGLVSSVMKMFQPGGSEYDVEDVVKEALDFLYDHIDYPERKRLTDAVDSEMRALIQGPLKKYMSYRKGKYILTAEGKEVSNYSQSRESVTAKIKEWANSNQRTLFD